MPSEKQLSVVLSEFARTMLTDFPIQGILDHLVRRIPDVLPLTAAGVTLISPGAEPRYIAASGEAALRYEQLQTELDEGPCLAAYRTGESVAVADLGSEQRFPIFAPRAVAEGLQAVFAFPLRSGQKRLGALDLYRDTPGSLTPRAMAAAQTLADVAAAYLINAQARADLVVASDRFRESALHDALTGLPNRVLLLQRLEHALLRSRRSGLALAVLFADLDRFKQVNDRFGHRIGDELLVAVAKRMRGHLRPGDTLARLSGDEFVILCEDLVEGSEIGPVATRIGRAFAEPFALSSVTLETSASIGIAVAGGADRTPESLLQEADDAMYQAKRKGGASHQVVDVGEQRLLKDLSSLERDLEGACRAGEFHVEYQPIVNVTDRHTVGVEALLRWDHPSRGPVPPSVLIPLAEHQGAMAEIGAWVLERSCLDCAWSSQWVQADELTMAVNVSSHQLMSSHFAATVEDVLQRTHIEPGRLTLEITESVVISDSERALIVLQDLKSLGVSLALDDFGTGYCSMNYLQRFPLDIVKIDQGFVAEIELHKASYKIASAVTNLAHDLDMTVIAEGVETRRQYEEIASLGCDGCQGFYFGRPMRIDALAIAVGEAPSDGDAQHTRGAMAGGAA